ncbi:MAG: hypothetical protein MZV64_18980 [Ignavibacteriales bacterium]|nr:hypothetical protein [Ignavibacteriales bacterium]
MNKFLERLNGGEILVADGATGSNLQKMGLKPGKPPEDLVIDDPDTILKLALVVRGCGFGHHPDLHLRRDAHADEGFEIPGSDS